MAEGREPTRSGARHEMQRQWRRPWNGVRPRPQQQEGRQEKGRERAAAPQQGMVEPGKGRDRWEEERKGWW
jgi:hypothetical protein